VILICSVDSDLIQDNQHLLYPEDKQDALSHSLLD